MKRTRHSAKQIVNKLREADALAATWRNKYNHCRPHSPLGYVPPAVYAAWLVIASPPWAGPPVWAAAYLITSMLGCRRS